MVLKVCSIPFKVELIILGIMAPIPKSMTRAMGLSAIILSISLSRMDLSIPNSDWSKFFLNCPITYSLYLLRLNPPEVTSAAFTFRFS